MAFIVTPILSRPVQTRPTTCPRMSEAPVTRRTALRFAAVSLAALSTSALAQQFDLKELKEDVEELKYDEEVTEVGPDPVEKNITRIKKKEEDPEYRAEEAAILKEGEDKYEAMLEKEKAEDAKIKAQFSGK